MPDQGAEALASLDELLSCAIELRAGRFGPPLCGGEGVGERGEAGVELAILGRIPGQGVDAAAEPVERVAQMLGALHRAGVVDEGAAERAEEAVEGRGVGPGRAGGGLERGQHAVAIVRQRDQPDTGDRRLDRVGSGDGHTDRDVARALAGGHAGSDDERRGQ